jgi:hypothetical protein
MFFVPEEAPSIVSEAFLGVSVRNNEIKIAWWAYYGVIGYILQKGPAY